MSMMCRGVKGATVAFENTLDSINEATLELLVSLVKKNQIQEQDLSSIIITTSPDLNATFPAKAIREKFNWDHVPFLCLHEMGVPGSLQKCIRVLLHWNTNKKQSEIVHVYLRQAALLRPDLKED